MSCSDEALVLLLLGAERRREGCEDMTYTDRFRSSLMALISIFLRPMVGYSTNKAHRLKVRQRQSEQRSAKGNGERV